MSLLAANPLRLYLLIFGFLLLAHAIIFRDVIASIPAVLSGDASIVREELIPFFNFGSQFWGEGTSKLTASEEVRVSYSFWTAWMRHHYVLPFAVVILNAISAFLLFYAFHRIGRYFYRKSLFGVMAALLAAILIHTILLYAKMAHFYVLIIGFSMFALSLSLVLEQLFFRQAIGKRNVIAVSLLTLLNPAIHYHVIFYAVALLIIVMQLILTVFLSRKAFWKYLKRNLIYFLIITALSLVPYVAYIFLTTSSSLSGVSTNIPVNYWMIYYTSLGLPFIFSLDTAGHLDLIRHGNYLAPIPRFGSMIVAGLIGGLFIFKQWASQHIVQKLFILTLFMMMLFAMWMTIGYSDNSPYSFHKVFGDLAIFFSSLGNGVGTTIAELMGTFINILRFPHRFQFIYYYAAGVLFMIALVWLRTVFLRRLSVPLATIAVTFIALFPIFANNDYRTALTSGDLASFVAPYRIPDDLKKIKVALNNKKEGKLFVLPTLESGRDIIQDGKRYSFLDKYLIYYLNEPTLYYGVGGNTENKIIAYLVYRAIAYNETWWQDILANNFGITDIIVPQHTAPREKGVTYLRNIDGNIQKSLARSTKYERSYDGKDYALYSLKKPVATDQVSLVDFEWREMLERFNGDEQLTGMNYFPLQIQAFRDAEGKKKLITDSLERSFYDLYVANYPKKTFVPRPVSLPFNSRYVSSTNFTNNALSLSTLYAKNDEYNYLNENVPSLVNLQRPSFIGLKNGDATLDVTINIPEDGAYRLLLHGASKGETVDAQFGTQPVQLKKIHDDTGTSGDYIDFTYFTLDAVFKKGKQVVSLKNTTQNAVLVDSMTLIGGNDLPTDFSTIQTDWLKVRAGEREGEYDLELKEGTNG
ncbi:MAG TPA: hypothetical protein VFZ62_02715 [Candidatus Saccharimonadales bacterium]